jgi:small subunit ribosomal protein S6
MPLYETVFIARQDVTAKQVEDYAKAFSKIVNDNGGETKRTESWGLRNLAYKIKKNKKGHYTLMHFDAPPAAMAEMERNIRLNEDVLRFLTVRIEKLPEGPSAILRQSDDEGDERGDRGEGRSRDRFSSNRGPRAPRAEATTERTEGDA